MPSDEQSVPESANLDPGLASSESGLVHPDPGSESSRSRGRDLIGFGVSAAILLVVFVGVLPKFGGYSSAWRSVTRMNSGEFAVLSVAVVVNIVIYVFPLQAALPGLRFWPAFMTRQTGFAISNAVPAGGAVGLSVQYAMLAAAGASSSASTAAIAIVALFNLLATLVLPVLGVLALLQSSTPSSSQVIGGVAALLVSALGALAMVAVLRSDRWALRIGEGLDRMVGAVTRRFGHEVSVSLAARLVSFSASTYEVLRSRWAAVSLTSLLQQLAQFAILVVALRTTGSEGSQMVSVLGVFAAFSLARLVGFLPLTPGGLGTVDASLVAVLVRLGADRADAFTATLVWRAASWAPQIVIGLATLVLWRLRPAGKSGANGLPLRKS